MDKYKIKRELLAIGIALYIREIDHNKAMELVEIELSKHEKLVKNLTIPRVSQQSEQLKAFADYAQKRIWEDGDKDLSEFVDEFLSL